MSPVPVYDNLTKYLNFLKTEMTWLADCHENGHNLTSSQKCSHILIDINAAIDDLAEVKTKVEKAIITHFPTELTIQTKSTEKNWIIIQIVKEKETVVEDLIVPTLTPIKNSLEQELNRQNGLSNKHQPSIDKLSHISKVTSLFALLKPKAILESIRRPLWSQLATDYQKKPGAFDILKLKAWKTEV